MTCGQQQFRTEIEFSTKRPHWNEEFTFEVCALNETLTVDLFDFDQMGVNDPMGRIAIPLADIKPDAGGKTVWYPLGATDDVPNPKGDIQLFIRCEYALTPRMLRVILAEGRDLPKMDPIRTCDPYATIQCEQTECKGDVFRNSQNPAWNQQYDFGVVMPGSCVTIHVYDYDKFSADDPMGKVVVSVALTLASNSLISVQVESAGMPRSLIASASLNASSASVGSAPAAAPLA